MYTAIVYPPLANSYLNLDKAQPQENIQLISQDRIPSNQAIQTSKDILTIHLNYTD